VVQQSPLTSDLPTWGEQVLASLTIVWKSSPTNAICLVENIASAAAIYCLSNPRHLRPLGRMQIYFARNGRS
jgi:hypothetical protein